MRSRARCEARALSRNSPVRLVPVRSRRRPTQGTRRGGRVQPVQDPTAPERLPLSHRRRRPGDNMSIRPRPKSSRLPRLRALRALRPRLPQVQGQDRARHVPWHLRARRIQHLSPRHGPLKTPQRRRLVHRGPKLRPLPRDIQGGGHHLIGNATCRLPASGSASAIDAVPVNDGVPPANGSVRMLAVAVLLDESTKIGDHVVCKNHHHALPLFVMDFRRLPGDRATSAS